jgi:predicted GNAT superfamily acetyltransferase
MQALIELFDDVWGTNVATRPVGPEHLRALVHSGNYVSAAYDADSMLGGAVAFFGPPAERTVHSDVVGVRREARDRQVGYALKLHQRAWALERDVCTITWTFDPLVSRNAHLNLTRLHAVGVDYLEDFYGDMADSINHGQGSDRVLVSWPLTAPDVVAAVGGDPSVPTRTAGEIASLLADVDGRPVLRPVDPATRRVRVAIPDDIEAVRRADPSLALGWRHAVRQAMGAELAKGAQITAFDRGVGYLMDRGDQDADHGG